MPYFYSSFIWDASVKKEILTFVFFFACLGSKMFSESKCGAFPDCSHYGLVQSCLTCSHCLFLPCATQRTSYYTGSATSTRSRPRYSIRYTTRTTTCSWALLRARGKPLQPRLPCFVSSTSVQNPRFFFSCLFPRGMHVDPAKEKPMSATSEACM